MSAFRRAFVRLPEVRAVAPGRVNLIGEHTDYNQGLVLPMPLPQRVQVELAARAGEEVRLTSEGFDAGGTEHAYRLGEEQPVHDWTDYVRGLTRVLREEGLPIGGFEAALESDLPVGGGLSSSAAVLVAMQRALRERFSLALGDLRIARLAQRVENEFVGARVGIMDPMVSSLGHEGAALYVDTRDLTHHRVAVPASVEVVVVNSGTGHRIAGGEYNRRREECERAASLLGVASLRDLEGRADGRLASLPEPLGARVRHVLTENDRVRAFVLALEEDRPERLGALLNESHRSLRDDFEVSTGAVDLLAELLRRQSGILGARLTGGGFGGAVVALAEPGAGLDAARRGAEEYVTDSGHVATVLLPRGLPAPSGAGPGRGGA